MECVKAAFPSVQRVLSVRSPKASPLSFVFAGLSRLILPVMVMQLIKRSGCTFLLLFQVLEGDRGEDFERGGWLSGRHCISN